MRFEKWQALGNDYIIVERDALPWALTPARVQRICDHHFGIGGDGILELSPPDEPGFVARLRIFNPDGSEAELSGNGAREAVMYLFHRGWTDQREFSIQTRAGEIRPTIHDDRTCTLAMGRARLTSGDYPDGAADGRGRITTADGHVWSFQHLQVGNPQAAIAIPDADELEALQLAADRPGHRDARRVPEPDQRVVLPAAGRGPHPRPDLRARRGGDIGVRHRRLGRGDRPCPQRWGLPGDGGPGRRRADRRRRRGAALHADRLGRARSTPATASDALLADLAELD